MKKDFRMLLIIPCFNEAESIGKLLKEVEELGVGYETLVIDDGSSDNTFSIASQLSPSLRLPCNLGIGGAVQTGIKYAERHGFDFCVQIDGDGQHPPGEVAKLLNKYRLSPHSIIVGSRYIFHDTFCSTWTRRFGSLLISWVLKKQFRNCVISDPTSGMRMMDRCAIELFSKHYPHDFPEPISLAWALREGLSVSEVSVKMRVRKHGHSSIVGWKPVAYMFRVLGYITLARITGIKN